MRPLYFISLSLSAFLALQGCKKNEPNNPSETPNRPPDPFELTHVANGSVDVDVMPTLTWNTSNDPDGDEVLYDLYLQEGNKEMSLIASHLTDTIFTIKKRLKIHTPYKWKVVAKDDSSERSCRTLFSFETRDISGVAKSTENSTTQARYGHSSFVFGEMLWLIGGHTSQIPSLNDVWNMPDSKLWINTNVSAPFSTRGNHTSLVFDNKMWVIGGSNYYRCHGDVWNSADGKQWILANDSAAFTPRYGHASVVFNNRMWVIGGACGTSPLTTTDLNDVWYSDNGRDWALATSNAAFAAQHDHAAVVFNDEMWLIGVNETGNGSGIWHSNNGIDWALASDNPAFGKRSGHALVVFDNKMWLIGGKISSSNTTTYKNDIWTSQDGFTWIQFDMPVAFSPRADITAVEYENTIWILSGNDNVNNAYNDIWYLD